MNALLIAVLTLAAPRVVTTIAGTPGVPGYRDGSANVALFDKPTWIDVDAQGAIYVVDRNNHVLRRIDPSTDVVKTLTIDSPYVPAPPFQVFFDFGGPYGGGIAVGQENQSNRREILVAATAVNRIASLNFASPIQYRLIGCDAFRGYIGSGAQGFADGVFSSAVFSNPTGIAVTPGYVSHDGANLSYPRYLTDFLYVADTGNQTIRRIRFDTDAEGCPVPIVETVAGTAGLAGSADGIGGAALFKTPRGIVAAPDGSLYVTDSDNHTVRKITAKGVVTTVAGRPGFPGSDDGPATQAHLNHPSGIDLTASGELIIADTGNHTIRMLTTNGDLVTIAGLAGLQGYADGPSGSALFNGPVGIRVSGDDIFVADTSNFVIRKISIDGAFRRRAVRH